MDRTGWVRQAFVDDSEEFTTSPLYQALCSVVADDDEVLELAARARPGQYPTVFLFGAVHLTLLRYRSDPLARFYPSIAGAAADSPEDAGPAFRDFCRRHAEEITRILQTRLVQTSHVQRSIGLRLGLALLADEISAPLHLVEVGASVGLNLGFARYGYLLDGHRFGRSDSPVQLGADVRGPIPIPDLDRLPPIHSVQGVDLNPIDARDPDARAWLQALVWPENFDQRRLLSAALDVVAADPPPIRAGDAIDVLPELARELPPGAPRVVFHCATRMHVPEDRRDDFDAAILTLGVDGPLWWISTEGDPDPDRRPPERRGTHGAALRIRGPDGAERVPAVVEGHLRWVEMVEPEDG